MTERAGRGLDAGKEIRGRMLGQPAAVLAIGVEFFQREIALHGKRRIQRRGGVPLGENETVAQGILGLVRIDAEHVPIGGGQHVGAGQRGRQMRGLRLVRHLDDLAAQLRGLGLQGGGIGGACCAPDCNVHRALQSRFPWKRRGRQSGSSGFVIVLGRQPGHVALEPPGPGDDVVDALFQRECVAPTELGAQFEAVERIGGVLARPLGPDLDAVLERLAEAGEDHLDQGADRNQLIAGDVIGLAERALARDLDRRVRHVGHVDEDAHRLAAAIKAKLLSGHRRDDGAWHDAIELLAGAIDVRGAGEHHREFVVREIGAQAHVAGGARYRVGRGRIERRVLPDPALGRAVDLRRRDVDVTLEPVIVAQPVVQPHGRDDVGHEPVVGMEPALADHALGGEIDHMGRALASSSGLQRLEVVVEIDLLEADAGPGASATVGQEGVMRLVRAAVAIT